MQSELSYLESLIKQGGPNAKDYPILNQVLANLSEAKQSFGDRAFAMAMNSIMGETLSTTTIQGLAYQQPHGYPCDYELLDRIHTNYLCQRDDLKKWDLFWQKHPTSHAIRNRVDYFKSLLSYHESKNAHAQVLNIASGPARGVTDYLTNHPESGLTFHCIDHDNNAIRYARKRCEYFNDKVVFHYNGAFPDSERQHFDLIWSAYLFDSLSDETFVRALNRLIGLLQKGGELVICNFSSEGTRNPFMDLFNWKVNYRSVDDMKRLALLAGAQEDELLVRTENESINLFLHIKKN